MKGFVATKDCLCFFDHLKINWRHFSDEQQCLHAFILCTVFVFDNRIYNGFSDTQLGLFVSVLLC